MHSLNLAKNRDALYILIMTRKKNNELWEKNKIVLSL